MTLLEADRLFRFFHAGGEETVALAGVTLRIDAGELVAITGPSGSGKSTLLNCLAGLDEPDGGTVRIEGVVLSRQPEADRARMRARHVGVLWQNANLLDHLGVRDNVLFAQQLAGTTDSARADHLLLRLGLVDRAHAWPSNLSGGEAARAGLAVALANDPTVNSTRRPPGASSRFSMSTPPPGTRSWSSPIPTRSPTRRIGSFDCETERSTHENTTRFSAARSARLDDRSPGALLGIGAHIRARVRGGRRVASRHLRDQRRPARRPRRTVRLGQVDSFAPVGGA